MWSLTQCPETSLLKLHGAKMLSWSLHWNPLVLVLSLSSVPFTHPPTLYSHILCFPLVWDECRRGWGTVMECIDYPTHPVSSPDWKTQLPRNTTGDWNALFNWQTPSKHLSAKVMLGIFCLSSEMLTKSVIDFKKSWTIKVFILLSVLLLQLLSLSCAFEAKPWHELWQMQWQTEREKEERNRATNRPVPRPTGELQLRFSTHSPLILHVPWGS